MLWMLGLWLWSQTVVLDVRLTDPEARRTARARLVDLVDEVELDAAGGAEEREWLTRARPMQAQLLRDKPPCGLEDEGQLVLTVDGSGWVLTRGTACRMGAGSGALTDKALRAALEVSPDLAPPPLLDPGPGLEIDDDDEEDEDDLSEEMRELREKSVRESTRNLRAVRPGALKRFAERMIGTRYRPDDEAGPGIGTGGLIRQLYLDVYGLDLGTDLVAMVQDHPTVEIEEKQARSQLRPGDLVFTVTGGLRPRGAYVYLGGGKVIQSTMTRGVVVDQLPTKLPENRWLIARRPLAGELPISSNLSTPPTDDDDR